jgi:chromosome segregation ATPase
MCPPFDFIKNRFRPKPKEQHEKSSQGKRTDLNGNADTYYFDERDPNNGENSQSIKQDLAGQPDKGITIENAILHLHDIEGRKTSELIDDLSPIRISAQASLHSIGNLADDLQNEEIKVEDQRFESTVENARNTVIASILKDANSSFPEINSYNDALKFKDRLESLTNRFGQLTGSHSKLFNVFLKKYAGKFRSEFEDFSNLNKKASKVIRNFELDIEDVKVCRQRLANLSSNLVSLRDSKERITIMTSEIGSLENDVEELTRRRHEKEQSDEYKNYSMLESKARELEKERVEFRDYVSDLFSHLNRAFTKYSYGVSKSVSRKIDTLSNAPWEIFLKQLEIDPNNADSAQGSTDRSSVDTEMAEGYRTLLIEIRGAVSKGVISLKDSDKVLTYFDRAIDIFPKIQSRGREIEEKAVNIRKNQNPKLFNSVRVLDEQIRRTRGEIEEKKTLVEELRNGVDEKSKEIHLLTDECNNLLTEIIGQEKTIISI